MKDIEKIKKDLIAFGKRYRACEEGIKVIKGTNLTELFANISPYISWCKENSEKTKKFNSIFDNDLVIEDGVLLCNCSKLTSVIIPNFVTKINNNAFENCTNLTVITIPNSVTVIDESAFQNCIKLESIIIPNSVTKIEYFTFSGCSKLISITIPNSVTSIEDFAFYRCNPNLKVIRK